METLETWLQRQYRLSATGMLASVSPCDIVRIRAGAGQRIHPCKGSIVASPAPGAYDPDPDYFFHWYRDSALVVDAMRVLHLDGTLPGLGASLGDFVRFSAGLGSLDGRALAGTPVWRERVAPAMTQYLRTDEELAAVHGDRVAAEARVNPDGTLDIFRWTRPQHDGPALRALALLRWMREVQLPAGIATDTAALVRADLGYISRHALDAGFDIWEEESGVHYYGLSLSAAALDEGADWLDGRAEQAQAREYRALARSLLSTLDGYWLETGGFFCARAPAAAARRDKDPDISIILAAVHSGRSGGAHSARDERVVATLARLDELFASEYAINRSRPAGRGPALGRYRGDRYYSGGAYFFSTLAAAELCYRAALVARGDAYLETVRAYAPTDGELPEQFDQRTGQPASARQLAWSHAAYITCLAARRAVT